MELTFDSLVECIWRKTNNFSPTIYMEHSLFIFIKYPLFLSILHKTRCLHINNFLHSTYFRTRKMRRIKLNQVLLDMISSGSDVVKLMSRFQEDNLTCETSFDGIHLFRLFLSAAAEHNHTELVTRLLADPRCDHNTSLSYSLGPIFLVIRKGDIRLINLFLHSRSYINVVQRHVVRSHDMPYREDYVTWDFMSPIEYACRWDQPEILRLLVLYDMQLSMTKRYEVFINQLIPTHHLSDHG